MTQIAIRFLATLTVGEGELETRHPRAGTFAALHTYVRSVGRLLIMVEEDVTYSETREWLNTWELAWRKLRDNEGLDVPPRLISSLCTLTRSLPSEVTLIDAKAVPFEHTVWPRFSTVRKAVAQDRPVLVAA